jgi:hypothetical protein
MRLTSQQADGSSADVASSSTTTATAPAAAGTTGLEQSLSELELGQQPTGRTSSSQAGADADAAAAAAAAAPTAAAAAAAAAAPAAVPRAFDVAAGSFQCVWFFCLGDRHHKPVVEWLQQQLAQQQQQQQQQQGTPAAAAADGGATGPAFTVVGTIKEVPQVSARGLLGVWMALVG